MQTLSLSTDLISACKGRTTEKEKGAEKLILWHFADKRENLRKPMI